MQIATYIPFLTLDLLDNLCQPTMEEISEQKLGIFQFPLQNSLPIINNTKIGLLLRNITVKILITGTILVILLNGGCLYQSTCVAETNSQEICEVVVRLKI
jgi:hypothetical protein